ncbi:MAG: hypothetical protein HPY65_11055 [Syntrophaceae bacterium]|nr:hypothetical protein [Syntrophaceae bacterium]
MKTNEKTLPEKQTQTSQSAPRTPFRTPWKPEEDRPPEQKQVRLDEHPPEHLTATYWG